MSHERIRKKENLLLTEHKIQFKKNCHVGINKNGTRKSLNMQENTARAEIYKNLHNLMAAHFCFGKFSDTAFGVEKSYFNLAKCSVYEWNCFKVFLVMMVFII